MHNVKHSFLQIASVRTRFSRQYLFITSVAEPHHFYADPATVPGKSLYAAPALFVAFKNSKKISCNLQYLNLN
jgi:hypothetical protein